MRESSHNSLECPDIITVYAEVDTLLTRTCCGSKSKVPQQSQSKVKDDFTGVLNSG